jgi:hypothetical protein
MFVSRESAVLNGMDCTDLAVNHRDLVRFAGPRDPKYQLIKSPIRRIIFEAPRITRNRLNATRSTVIEKEDVRKIKSVLDAPDSKRKLKQLSQTNACSSWIIEEKEEEYVRWMSSANDLSSTCSHLWIYGPEGKGKTSVSLAAIAAIEERVKAGEARTRSGGLPTLLAYFFLDSSPDYRSADDVLRSLLLQLIEQHEVLAAYMKKFIKKQTNRTNDEPNEDPQDSANVRGVKTTLSVDNLLQTLHDMLEDDTIGTVFFVINRLHELPEEDASTKKFLQFFKEHKHDKARWMFTSGEYAYIKTAFESNECTSMDLNLEKYRRHLHNQLEERAQNAVNKLSNRRKYDQAFRFYATSLIAERAQSPQWIDLACVRFDALPKGSNEFKARRLLDQTPQNMKTLLDGAWKVVSVLFLMRYMGF